MKLKTEVAIIGAGPGGYVAAIRLGKLGKKVVLVEKDGKAGLGGVCMHHGCIPSKALILASKFLRDIKTAGEMGINVSSVSLDAVKLQSWKDDIVTKLQNGVDFLLTKNNVKWIQGEAFFKSSKTLAIKGNEEIDSIDFDYAVVATGAGPKSLPEVQFDGKNVISFYEALDLKEIPKSMLVIGGGYISLEMATCYAKLGSNVKIVHRRDHVLTEYDEDVVNVLQKRMKEDGIELILNSTVSKIEKIGESNLRVHINSKEKGEVIVETNKVLQAVGLEPNSKKLGLENTKVKIDDEGFIVVDNKRRTTDEKIFAIGDVCGKPMLAHKASREGKIVAEVIAGKEKIFDNICIPSVIFGDPELAVAGMTENQAKKNGYETNVGKFPFSALGRAWVERETKGFVKIIEEKSSGKLLGIVIVGPDASNMISEGSLAIEKELKTEDIINTIHPHPTLPESVLEAAEAVKKLATHIVNL